MSKALMLFALVCLLLAVDIAGAQSGPPAMRGMLREKGKPIAEAAVFLQSLEDKHCAKTFAGRKADRKAQQEVDRCVRDVSAASPDSQGYYQFAGVKAGWYAVHFLWNITETPNSAMSLFKEGRWGVIYDKRKDTTGKYDAMAQDVPFYYSDKYDAVRDFDAQR
jgi:hypothetical protein